MKIEIKYSALLEDLDPEQLTPEVFDLLNNLKDNDGNFADYLDSSFEDFGIEDGSIHIQADSTTKKVFAIINYFTSLPLSKEYMDKLVESTSNIIRDGYQLPLSIETKGKTIYVYPIDSLISISTSEEVNIRKRNIRSPIFSLIENDELDKIDEYLNPEHLSSTDKFEFTPLMIAIWKGYNYLGLKMIERGADVNYIGKNTRDTPLRVAAIRGNVAMGKIILKQGGKGNINHLYAPKEEKSGEYGMTALMYAVNGKHFDFVKLLLDNGADVNIKNRGNETAIMFATDGSHQSNKIFELILQRNPDVYIKSWRGRTVINDAMDRSKNNNDHEMKKLMIRYFPSAIFSNTP